MLQNNTLILNQTISPLSDIYSLLMIIILLLSFSLSLSLSAFFFPLSAATKVLIAPVVILLVVVFGALALVIGNIITRMNTHVHVNQD